MFMIYQNKGKRGGAEAAETSHMETRINLVFDQP